LKAPCEDGSSFRADLEQSTPNERRFMKFISRAKSMAVPHQIHTYTELRQQIHDDLRIQHPEWVEPNGECPICDSYESRLTKMLDTLTRTGSTARFKIDDSATEAGNNEPRSSRAKEASQHRAAG
jgi:hypothetical protein